MDTIRLVIIGLPDRTFDLVLFKKKILSPQGLRKNFAIFLIL